MTITVVATKNRPAVLLDKIHVDTFTITQGRTTDTPLRVGKMGFCLYGCDVDGNRIYDDVTVGVNDVNVDVTVSTAAVNGGQTPESFMADCIAEKATLETARADGSLTDAKLMAYFELAMVRFAELNGGLVIQGLE